MKKFAVLIFVLALTVGIIVARMFSFGSNIIPSPSNLVFGEKIVGSGHVISRNVEVGSFSGVSVGGAIQVFARQSEDTSVRIEAEDNIQSRIITEVNDGVLVVKTRGRMSLKKGIKVFVSTPEITYLKASGASSVDAKSIKTDLLKLRASGASKIVLNGKTENVQIRMSGASRIDASELQANNGNVRSSGASFLKGNFVDRLRVKASGASSIKYKGSPDITKRISGGSNVSQF